MLLYFGVFFGLKWGVIFFGWIIRNIGFMGEKNFCKFFYGEIIILDMIVNFVKEIIFFDNGNELFL